MPEIHKPNPKLVSAEARKLKRKRTSKTDKSAAGRIMADAKNDPKPYVGKKTRTTKKRVKRSAVSRSVGVKKRVVKRARKRTSRRR